MKKGFAYLLSHALFWVGDLFSRSSWFDWAYQGIMTWSMDIQDWAGNETPWGKPQDRYGG